MRIGTIFSLAGKNQVTAALLAAVALAVVNAVHLLPLYVNLPAALILIVDSISFAWHFDAASKGIFDTRDIAFYIVVTAFLLFWCVFVLEKRKGKK